MLARHVFRPRARRWLGQWVFAVGVAAMLAGAAAGEVITIETVHVGNPGNIADTAEHSGNPDGQGAVPYVYDIGKYEVTAGQYCAFLNAVAATDTYGLYNTNMARTDDGSGISRDGVSGGYTYSVDGAFINRPVNYVSWGDAARFANWLHNGQPTGVQDLTTTEDGSYYLNGATTYDTLAGVTRTSGATWVIPSEDEWYKAAYHKNDGDTANYFWYPTSSDSMPGRDLADPLPGNNANYTWTHNPIDSEKWYTTVVGEFQNSPSPYGTFDQGGNVAEFNETEFLPTWRVGRGGAFLGAYTDLRSSSRGGGPATWETEAAGFRVANVPEPSAAGLILAGALCGVLWRRRR